MWASHSYVRVAYNILVMLLLIVSALHAQSVNKYLREEARLNLNDIRRIGAAEDNDYFAQTLQKILIPRVVGTSGHEQVRQFIVGELQSLGYAVEQDSFVDRVPILGDINFTNIIGRLNENAARYLTLACHYDSKYFANSTSFVAAVDSAVPCTQMLYAAKTLQPMLGQSRANVSLMLIFFDGEEAFESWTASDSVYGSRHLVRNLRDINRIDALVLLDLIGAANPTFYNYFRQTIPLFRRCVAIENALFASDMMCGTHRQFIPRNSNARIGDDHEPFLRKNVPVMHVIATPFPPQWHTLDDDYAHLDFCSIGNFNKILRLFTYEYLTASLDTANFRTIIY